MKRIATAIAAMVLLTGPAYTASAAVPSAGAPPGKSPSAAPDFGTADKVVAAWKAHAVSDDELVRYGTQWLIGDPALPDRFKADRPLGELSAAYQVFLSQHAAAASPQTRDWLASVFAGDKGGAAKPAAAAKSASVATGSAALPDDPNNECGLDVTFLLDHYSCRYRTADFRIYYNIASGTAYEPWRIPGVFTRASDTPDGILQLVEGATSAFSAYRKMGYQISLTSDGMPIYIGSRAVEKEGAALTWPFDSIGEGKGNPVIMMPSDFRTGRTTPKTQYNYLPRHEVFHAFQYHYIPNASILQEVASTNWWMEATAEWATRKSYDTDPGYYGEPGEDTYYARNADQFFGAPERAVNAWDRLGQPRQYSANPFATYLSERVDSTFVRRSWENYASGDNTAMSAIMLTFAQLKADASAVMADFAVANYRLSYAGSVLSPTTGSYVPLPGYNDPQAGTLWREVLQDTLKFPTAGDSYGAARPSRRLHELGWHDGKPTSTGDQTFQLQPGGAFYADIAPQGVLNAPDDRGIVKVHVNPDPKLRYKLLTWKRNGSGGNVYPGMEEMVSFDANGDATTRVADPGTVFTLVVARVDLVNDSATAAADVLTGGWNAALVPDASTRVTVEGDPGTASTLYTAQHNWFTFDTTPGQRFYVAGSVPEYATVYLHEPSGNVVATDYAESDARRHMFGGNEYTAKGGTYYVEVMPRGNSATTAATVRVLSDVPTFDATVDGDPAVPVTVKWGQHTQVTFQGTAGQNVYFAGQAPGVSYYELFDPSGKSLRWDTETSSGRVALFDRTQLGTTGTYTVKARLDARQTDTSLFRVLSDIPTAAATIDGPAATATGTKWGQRTRVTFQSPNANQLFYAAANSGLYRHWTLYGPRGDTILTATEWDSNRNMLISPRTLAEPGTYVLEADPQFNDNPASTVQLYGSRDAATIAVDGAGTTLNVAAGGRQAAVSFTANAGQKVSLSASGPWGTTFELRDPKGQYVTSVTSYSNWDPTSVLNGRTLSTTGEYQLWIAPPPARGSASTVTARVVTAP
ncbi:hypothetical protein [Yinghuangia seranimata]|uniref:hypothetical protein n=1 Tax=Yinghuangia seranimata TaxID=408067 RepID=UPI00248CF06B|nr:hypothetical protein [Yinghuangia seranimata]MDI2130280.1 hypothetical protein [Yinghuangia seranimata]